MSKVHSYLNWISLGTRFNNALFNTNTNVFALSAQTLPTHGLTQYSGHVRSVKQHTSLWWLPPPTKPPFITPPPEWHLLFYMFPYSPQSSPSFSESCFPFNCWRPVLYSCLFIRKCGIVFMRHPHRQREFDSTENNWVESIFITTLPVFSIGHRYPDRPLEKTIRNNGELSHPWPKYV